MPFRRSAIRLIASILFALKRRAILRAGQRYIACAGTSGKTNARLAIAHALSTAGAPVVSMPLGYTNELGVVLSCLGASAAPLRTPRAWMQLMRATPPAHAWVLFETAADFTTDAEWVARRLPITYLVIPTVDPDEWARPLAARAGSYARLAASLLPGGALIAGDGAASLLAERLPPGTRTLAVPAQREFAGAVCQRGERAVRINYAAVERDFVLVRTVFAAQKAAFAAAAALIEDAGFAAACDQFLFTDFLFPTDRLSIRRHASGACIIADTYKSIPLCARYVLSLGRELPAPRRFLVMSELVPAPRTFAQTYAALGRIAARYERCYFIGGSAAFAALSASAPSAVWVTEAHPYARLAETLSAQLIPGDLVVIKGAARFALHELLSEG